MIGEETDSPRYRYVDKRIPHLVNYLQSYFYLLNSQTKGAPGKICNYKNYFQSIVYDFLERFGNIGNNSASQLVLNFEGDIKSILGKVNKRNAQWFRHLLALAEKGWDNKTAFDVMSKYLNKNFLLETVVNLEEKKNIFSSELFSLGPGYKSWLLQTWETIGNLEI